MGLVFVMKNQPRVDVLSGPGLTPPYPNRSNPGLTMFTSRSLSHSTRMLLCAFLAILGVPLSSFGQERQTGILACRIFNPARGEYTPRARVTIEATTLEVSTDVAGRFRFDRTPVGKAQVAVYYTEAAVEAKSAVVNAGATTQLDFEWMASSAHGGVVTLEKLTISASLDMSSSAAAINTQLFTPNTMSVVANEYGPVPRHTIRHVLNYAPGITIELGGLGNPNTILQRSMNSRNTPLVTIGI